MALLGHFVTQFGVPGENHDLRLLLAVSATVATTPREAVKRAWSAWIMGSSVLGVGARGFCVQGLGFKASRWRPTGTGLRFGASGIRALRVRGFRL